MKKPSTGPRKRGRWRAIPVAPERATGEHTFCSRCGYSDYLPR